VKIVRFEVKNVIKYGLVQDDVVKSLNGNPFAGDEVLEQSLEPVTGEEYPLEEVKLLAPCQPSKIVAIGRNYLSHAKERDKVDLLTSDPLLFLKPSTAVIGPEDTIILPKGSEKTTYYEGELGVVISKKAKNVPEDRARDYVLGYTCINDVSEKYYQKLDVQWTRGKGFDTFAPVGPWIETEVDPDDLKLETLVNDVLSQFSRTSQLIFGIDRLVSHASTVMTLLPGDVIATGTPAGVGRIIDGDIVDLRIEGIGTLRNYVANSK